MWEAPRRLLFCLIEGQVASGGQFLLSIDPASLIMKIPKIMNVKLVTSLCHTPPATFRAALRAGAFGISTPPRDERPLSARNWHAAIRILTGRERGVSAYVRPSDFSHSLRRRIWNHPRVFKTPAT